MTYYLLVIYCATAGACIQAEWPTENPLTSVGQCFAAGAVIASEMDTITWPLLCTRVKRDWPQVPAHVVAMMGGEPT